jgi:hypothetical protein
LSGPDPKQYENGSQYITTCNPTVWSNLHNDKPTPTNNYANVLIEIQRVGRKSKEPRLTAEPRQLISSFWFCYEARELLQIQDMSQINDSALIDSRVITCSVVIIAMYFPLSSCRQKIEKRDESFERSPHIKR